jgi:hypothetical protein
MCTRGHGFIPAVGLAAWKMNQGKCELQNVMDQKGFSEVEQPLEEKKIPSEKQTFSFVCCVEHDTPWTAVN